MARLIIRIPQKSPMIMPVQEDVITVGRSRANTIPLGGDAGVSRQHCRLERRGRNYLLADSGSRNGTRLNGRKIDPAQPPQLKHGDRIQIGATVIVFDEPELAPADAPPAVPGAPGAAPGAPPVASALDGIAAGSEPVGPRAADNPETRTVFGEGSVRCGACGSTSSTGRRKPGDKVGCNRCRAVYVLPRLRPPSMERGAK